MEWGFRHAVVLTLVPLIGIVSGALLYRLEQNRDARLASVGALPRGTSWRRIIAPPVLMALLLIIIARPYRGFRDISVSEREHDLMIVLDVSLSMEAADALPSRLGAAKRKAIDIIDWVSRHRAGTRIGLTLFAGSAHLYCPLTADYGVIRQFVQSVQSSFISSGGSGLEAALREAARALTPSLAETGKSATNSPVGTLILLSDGEDLSLTHRSLESLEAGELSIQALGFGTPEGAPIITARGHHLRDDAGNTVITTLKLDTLSQIARLRGGNAARAVATDDDFAPFLEAKIPDVIRDDRGSSSARTVRVYDEVGPLLALAILAGLSVIVMTGHHRSWLLVVWGCFLVPCSALSARADSPSPSTPTTAREAYLAYERGEYAAAYEGFRGARENDPTDSDILHGQASAAFRLQRHDEAAQLFDELASMTPRASQRFEAHFNRGNAELAAKKFSKAIESYDRALALRKDDIPTTANRALAEQLLEDEKQQERQKQRDQNTRSQAEEKNQRQSSENQQRESGSNGESSPTDRSAHEPSDSDPGSSETPANAPKTGDDEHRTGDNTGREQPERTAPPSSGVANDPAEGNDSTSGHSTPIPSPAQSTTQQTDTNNKTTRTSAGSSVKGGTEAHDHLPAAQARDWLNSLPEAPVLLRRYYDPLSEQRTGQSW
jgi:Ca-activated chloride channel family protein